MKVWKYPFNNGENEEKDEIIRLKYGILGRTFFAQITVPINDADSMQNNNEKYWWLDFLHHVIFLPTYPACVDEYVCIVFPYLSVKLLFSFRPYFRLYVYVEIYSYATIMKDLARLKNTLLDFTFWVLVFIYVFS